MKRGQIAEPIRVHATGAALAPLEFSWRGRRHRVRQVLRLIEGGGYQLRTSAGLRCQISQRSGFWQMDRVLLIERTVK